MLLGWLLLVSIAITGFSHTRTTSVPTLDTRKGQRGDEQSEQDFTSLSPLTTQRPGLDHATALRICLLMIVRNEEDNLRENLPFWRDIASCYVIGIDDRTTDGTLQVIRDTLPEDRPKFEDFAQARNEVLRSMAHHFQDVSHVLIADADWRPDLATVDMSELDLEHNSFQFLIWDHSGHTSRLAGWLLRNDKRLRFKYRIHEVLDSSAVSWEPSKTIGWEIRVVESPSSWHTESHGHSRTAERFKADLELLERDYKDDPHDLHTLFYLGITTYSFMETLVGKGTHQKTPELEGLITDGMNYLHEAIRLYGTNPGIEFVWSSLRWLAYGYQYFVGEAGEAERWYRECIAYDPARVDCIVFLSRLHLDSGDLNGAWEEAKLALLNQAPTRRAVDYFYIHECFVPVQAATVISQRIRSHTLGDDSMNGLLTLGKFLMEHHQDHCKHGVVVDTAEDINNLKAWFQSAIDEKGLDVTSVKHRTLLREEPSLLGVLLEKWGTGAKVAMYARDAPGTRGQVPHSRSSQGLEGGSHLSSEDKNRRNASQVTQDLPIPNDPNTVELLYPGTAEDLRGEMAEDFHDEQLTQSTCALLAHEVWIRTNETLAEMRARNRAGVEVQQDFCGVMDAREDPQISERVLSAMIARETGAKHSFRALIVGGGKTIQEELSAVVWLLAQSSLISLTPDVTYLHPDGQALEAIQVATAQCPEDIAIQSRVHFIRSTLENFVASTEIDKPFDYVDVGAPVGRRKGERGKGLRSAAEYVDTLGLLIPNVRPSACMIV